MSRRHGEQEHRRGTAEERRRSRSDRYRGRGDGDDGSGYDRRYASRYGDRYATAREAASEGHGRDAGGRMPERAHGGRRSSPHARQQGSPRVGSQRGEDSVQGVSGRVGWQFGDLHVPQPSQAAAEGFHGEEQFAGGTGRSSRDRRYGSRRGHGSQRREDPRTRPDE